MNELNARFARYARSNTYFYLNDINWLSGAVGLDRWANRKHWHMYKSAMDVSLIPLYSMNVSFIIKSILVLIKKLLLLTLIIHSGVES